LLSGWKGDDSGYGDFIRSVCVCVRERERENNVIFSSFPDMGVSKDVAITVPRKAMADTHVYFSSWKLLNPRGVIDFWN